MDTSIMGQTLSTMMYDLFHGCVFDESSRDDANFSINEKNLRESKGTAMFRHRMYEKHMDLMSDMASKTSLHEMVHCLHSYCYEHLQAQHVQFYLTHSKCLVVVNPSYLQVKCLPSLSRGIVGRVYTTKETFTCADFSNCAEYDSSMDMKQWYSNQVMHCIPMKTISKDELRVVAILQFTRSGIIKNMQHHMEEILMLERMGTFLGAMLEKIQNYHDLSLSNRLHRALLKLQRVESSSPILFRSVSECIQEIVQADEIKFYSVDCTSKQFFELAIDAATQSSTLVAFGESSIGTCALKRKIMHIYHEGSSDGRAAAIYIPIGKPIWTGEPTADTTLVLELLSVHQDFGEYSKGALETFAMEIGLYCSHRITQLQYLNILSMAKEKGELRGRKKSYQHLLETFSLRKIEESPSQVHTREHNLWRTQKTRTLKEIQKSEAIHRHIPSCVDFNPFDSSDCFLMSLAEEMFVDLGLCDYFGMSKEVLHNFVVTVHEYHNPNPYHNFFHSFSVLHMAYEILRTTHAGNLLTPEDALGCLVAAFCHDVDHPGHNNQFEVNSRSHLAIQYGDNSVLERHHVHTTFNIILNGERCNILSTLAATEYNYIRKLIIESILGTDMAHHFTKCEELARRICATKPVGPPAFSWERESMQGKVQTISNYDVMDFLRDEWGRNAHDFSVLKIPKRIGIEVTEDREFLVKTIVHAADLSSQVLSQKLALEWGNRINKEFAYQALIEQADGLEVSFHQWSDPLELVEGQSYFATHVVSPLWGPLATLLPELQGCIDNLQANIAHYKMEINRLTAEHVQRSATSTTTTTDAKATATVTPWTPPDFFTKHSVSSPTPIKGQALAGACSATPAKFMQSF